MNLGRVTHRTIGQVCALTSRTERTALLLLRLIRELRPRTCIELGTSVGISACYQAAALKMNGTGNLITLEGAGSVASVAAQNFACLGLDNVEVIRGRFQDTLPEVLHSHPAVDYAFIDGHHDEAATIKYFNAFLPSLAGSAVMVFNDIQWSAGMNRAWNAIQRHGSVRVSVDLGSIGSRLRCRICHSPSTSALHFELGGGIDYALVELPFPTERPGRPVLQSCVLVA